MQKRGMGNNEVNMKTCGVDLKACDAIIVILEGTKASWKFIDCEPRKISIPNDEDSSQIRAFRNSINALVKHHSIQRIAIKKRAKRGKFAGGPVSFKMEGVIQLVDNCEVLLLPPQTIAKVVKNNTSVILSDPLKKYQHDAFYTALTALDN
jgi:hypothetical protein